MAQTTHWRAGFSEDDRTIWSPCPGCDKCEATGGYVLRRGSWRHTRAHETVLMCVKGMNYYADQERVREVSNMDSGWAKQRIANKPHPKFYHDGNSDPGGGGFRGLGGFMDYRDNMTSGRNPRSVLTPSPESYGRNHYAVFPRHLIGPLLRATAPTRVCPVCGAPWCPVVEREPYEPPIVAVGVRNVDISRGDKIRKLDGKSAAWLNSGTTVLAHRPTCTCNHDDWQPGWVLDSFVGSGTTLEVCAELGVNCIGLDISHEYLDDHAKPRIRLTPAKALESLPLFAALEMLEEMQEDEP